MAGAGRSRRSSWRVLTVALFLALSTSGLVARLAFLQLVSHQQYQLEAQGEHLDRRQVLAHRGSILDQNGYPLATSVDTFDILVNHQAWQDVAVAEKDAQQLAPLLSLDAVQLKTTVAQGSGDVEVAASVSYDSGHKIQALGLPNVIVSPDSSRMYPEGDLASPLLGFIGRDQTGLTGIEHDLNGPLTGKPGVDDFERDSLGNPIGFGYDRSLSPQAGADVVLTIDRTLQTMAERELDAAIQRTHADGGDIIMMDPQTGAVFAMASRPAFQLTKLDLNQTADPSLFRLRAVTDEYEPGSVFKLITFSAALNEGRITPNTTYVDTGTAIVGGRTFHNWDFSANGLTSMTQVLVKSLNTGSIWVSQRLGSSLFYHYVQAFGFGTPTHVGLSGEAAGTYRTPDDPTWSPSDLASNSFGQGLSATPLQVLTAVCAIANGGKLMQPYMVQSVRDSSGDHPTKPVNVRQPITPQTATTLTDMMKAVVESNTLAVVPGYTVAGKSGTAYVPNAGVSNSEGDAYRNETTIPSYLGFGPIGNPRLAVLVKLNDLGTADLGGELTAPVFSKLMHDGLEYLGVPENSPTTTAGR